MAIPKVVSILKGTWQGSSSLNFSEDPAVPNVFESSSRLQIETDRLNTFATVKYTWSHDEQVQDGTILIAGSESKDAVSAGWVDSWHQNGSIMSFTGTGMSSERVQLSGSYKVEGHPDWGWRIEVGLVEDSLVVEMTNISPEGDETWAVRANYWRTDAI